MQILFGIWPYRILRTCLGAYFVVAGALKLTEVAAFTTMIADFGIVFVGFELPTAIGLLTTEILVGLALIVDLRGALLVIVGLLALFVAVLSYGVGMGLDIECGCLGPGRSHSLQGALVVDGVLLLTCAYLYASRRVRSAPPQTLKRFLQRGQKTPGGFD